MTQVLNPRIDSLLATLEAERERLQVSRGELIVFTTLVLAGLYEQAKDRDVLTESIGFLLAYASNKETSVVYFERLKKVCEVETQQPLVPES